MAIVNSIATYSGEGYQLIQNIGTVVTTTGSPNTVRVPASGSISPTVTRGLWRCKIYNETSAVTLTNITIQAGDGTNLATIDNFVPAAALTISATAYADVCGDFIFDTAVAASAGGATGTLIFGGATFFNFVINVATASGSASADCEIAAAP
jgi:hypothetical protein